MTESTKIDYVSIVQDLRDEADLCRNETATDIADLLDDAASCIVAMKSQFVALRADLAAAQEARQRAEALAEEYKKDAERYRYLRSRDKDEVFNNDGVKAGVWIDCTAEDGTLQLLTFEDADAAIDAVFAGEPK